MVTSERRVAALSLSFGVLLGAGAWLGLREVARAATAPAVGSTSGFVVWESKRSGKWRLWRANLDGSSVRQLSQGDDDRMHCCAHIAPDGKSIAWLALDPGPDRYPRSGPQLGSLRLFSADGSGERELAPRARTYGEHRAAVWRDPRRLIWIDGSGRTLERDLATARDSVLVEASQESLGWLIDPTLRTANQNRPSFSRYDPVRKAVIEMQGLGGCQPWVSADGAWGIWTAGAGGPLDAIDLATRKTHQLVSKNDPRLPAPHRYLYFPMLSADRRFLVFAASDGGHDHWKADYDIHLARLDPERMEVVGSIARLASDPAPDRFPDVYAGAPDDSPRPARAPSPPPIAPAAAGGGAALFVWDNQRAPNLVLDAALGERRSFAITAEGGARFDGQLRMQVGPGTFRAAEDASTALLEGAKAANEISMVARVTPARSPQSGVVLAFGGKNDTHFALRQRGHRLSLRLGLSFRGWVERDFDLGPLVAGRVTHVAWSYRPGRLVAWRDGVKTLETAEAQGDFFRWRVRPLTFGGESWSGSLDGIAVFGRVLRDEEVAERAQLEAKPATSAPPRVVSARLIAKTPTPTLDEISPYREALAVYQYEALDDSGQRLRVAHWVRLDGEVLPVADRRIGESVELRLEPFSSQPQLESIFLGDALTRDAAGPLYFDVTR